jgi:D-alanine-D-alanine ligase
MKKVAVIMGGYSSEFDISLKSGHTVIANLPKEVYEVYEVHIRPDAWVVKIYEQFIPIDKNDFSFNYKGQKINFDVVFNAIHGTPGEDGAILAYFEMLGLPHTSASFDKMALTFNKKNTLSVVKSYGIPTARSMFINQKDVINTQAIIDKIGLPCFVKPNRAGSSFGISKVYTEEELLPAIDKALKEDREVIVESFLDGPELSVGVLKYNGDIKVLPMTQIISDNDFFDYEAKYLGKSKEITPADIPASVKNKVSSIAQRVYEVLDLNGFSRAEYILVDGVPHFLEINMVPGLTEASILPQQVKAAGLTLTDLFVNALESAK